MILVDTSIWVELLRGGGPLQVARQATQRLHEIVTCGPILQEVIQGLDDSRDAGVFREAFLAFPRLEDPLPIELFLEAGSIYRSGRRRGYTIRSSVDCLIAAIAIRNNVVVWHHSDRDYTFIARYTDLKTIL